MESVEKLIQAYSFLSKLVSEELSESTRLIRSGDFQKIAQRLREEIDEAVRAFEGTHSHDEEKTPLVRELMSRKGIDPAAGGILLELSQVSYWCLLYHLAKGGEPDAEKVCSALKRGANAVGEITEMAAAADRDLDEESVFLLIGRLSKESRLPLDLFAELDLLEMEQKPYLKDILHGP
jgi:hypothetical protein